ncbi:peroxiredoxin [Arthrobacter ulcerisalmonis]|uniref:peroxiredoxin n=1 Tax=Arthrobacter sp. B1I2 TaxID=3042263 RepID=UPI0027871D81|nr:MULTISPECIES: peroxiredoxin [Arthrobacter]MDQ0663968.1 peroxiredoxin [Arthrobacter ulcerisalmonis]MDQ0731872.1 peroxiredoxin [Arthrobacter sp. B1I2]
MTAAVEAASAAVPVPGATAPDFELANQYGEPVRLSSFRGQNVALVFYPFAFSGICTGELCEIRDNLATFEDSNAVVLAVSVDSKFSLRAYAERDGYTFDLLADFWPHGAVASAYGVFDAVSGMAKRATFIIDADGRISYRVVNPRGQARDFAEYRAALADLKQA